MAPVDKETFIYIDHVIQSSQFIDAALTLSSKEPKKEKASKKPVTMAAAEHDAVANLMGLFSHTTPESPKNNCVPQEHAQQDVFVAVQPSQQQQQRVPGSSVASSPAAQPAQPNVGHSDLQAVRSVRGPGMVFSVPVLPSTTAADGIEPTTAQAHTSNTLFGV